MDEEQDMRDYMEKWAKEEATNCKKLGLSKKETAHCFEIALSVFSDIADLQTEKVYQ